MDRATRFRSPRKFFLTIVLIAAVVALAGSLTQCRMVTDNLVGVHPSQSAADAGSCFSACAHEANEQNRDESDLHKANMKACGGDPGCLADEEARHEARVAEIQQGRKDCQAGCHHQGGGRGGD